LNRLCLGYRGEACTALTARTYCQRHERMVDQERRARRGKLYDWGHRLASRQQREAEPSCEWCGADTDLTADHIDPGDAASRLRTLCRSCNATRANRARARRRARGSTG